MAETTLELGDLVARAGAAAGMGRWQEAERLWEEVRALQPDHPQALFALGVHAMQARNFTKALRLIESACAVSPRDLLALMTLGVVRRELADPQGELAAIDKALSIDPYFLPALLAKAAWFERQGSAANAAMTYRVALKFAPPEPGWPAELKAQLLHAREVSLRHAVALEDMLLKQTVGVRGGLGSDASERWREAASIAAGRSEPYVSQCNQFYVPRLPATPFFERERFKWVAALEAKTPLIQRELAQLLQEASEDFAPYVAYPEGAPVNQWRELNHSRRWSGFHLWRNGQPVEENIARCPETAAALREAGMAEIGGLCPNAMFSALAPHTHIPPHTGETNARIVVHLPLVVPEGCLYRVGFETRRWEVGKVLIFDDTLDHEARNDSDELRVVLLFDVWNPYLTDQERVVARSMMEALRAAHS